MRDMENLTLKPNLLHCGNQTPDLRTFICSNPWILQESLHMNLLLVNLKMVSALYTNFTTSNQNINKLVNMET